MSLPPLLTLPDENTYRAHFVREYCSDPVITFDGLAVWFYPERFDHAFYRDSSPTAQDKKIFDLQRAQRMDWIRHVLYDPNIELYRRIMSITGKERRIALEPTTPYAVIIQIDSHSLSRARFITAYVVSSSSTLANMRANPAW
jgi:hypothetical protein